MSMIFQKGGSGEVDGDACLRTAQAVALKVTGGRISSADREDLEEALLEYLIDRVLPRVDGRRPASSQRSYVWTSLIGRARNWCRDRREARSRFADQFVLVPIQDVENDLTTLDVESEVVAAMTVDTVCGGMQSRHRNLLASKCVGGTIPKRKRRDYTEARKALRTGLAKINKEAQEVR